LTKIIMHATVAISLSWGLIVPKRRNHQLELSY
jgi:hypothetical protein